jgi:hypothetical protein
MITQVVRQHLVILHLKVSQHVVKADSVHNATPTCLEKMKKSQKHFLEKEIFILRIIRKSIVAPPYELNKKNRKNLFEKTFILRL